MREIISLASLQAMREGVLGVSVGATYVLFTVVPF
jgi:hypothetical protein